MSTKAGTLVTDINFLTALEAYTVEIEQISEVDEVKNLVRMKTGYTPSQYAIAYSNLSSTLSLSVSAPFYLSDLDHIARTSIHLSIEKNSDNAPSIVKRIRSLNSNSGITQYLQEYGVTGDAATDMDQYEDIAATFPNLCAVLIVAMFVLLFLHSASIYIPLKTLLTTFTSLMISYAFIILIFQEGPTNAENLLEFKSAGTLDLLNLLFIFAVSFGLALDYEGIVVRFPPILTISHLF
jgi:uncharacterized membrane protein YdfJ with MMPL/SSD domain